MKNSTFLILLLYSLASMAQYEITSYFFPDKIDDLEYNEIDEKLYIVQGNLDYVSVRSIDMIEEQQLFIGNRPYKITFNLDGTEIFSTEKTNGKVSKLDTKTGTITSWDISNTLQTSDVYDIAYGANGMVFVSADRNPWADNPFATTVALNTNNSEQHALIDGVLMAQKSQLFVHRESGWLYFINTMPYDTLFKVNLNNIFDYQQLESDSYRPFLSRFDINPVNGELVSYMGIVDTENMTFLTDVFNNGYFPRFNHSGSEFTNLEEFSGDITLKRFNASTYQSIEDLVITESCNMQNSWRYELDFMYLPQDDGWLIWRGDTVCIIKKINQIFINGFESL